MRLLLAAVVSVLVSVMLASLASAQQTLAPELNVLETHVETAYLKFSIACAAVSCGGTGDDDALVFDIQFEPTTDVSSYDVLLNGRRLRGHGLRPKRESTILSPLDTSLSVKTPSGIEHEVDLAGTVGIVETANTPVEKQLQRVRFQVSSVDGVPAQGIGFSVLTQPTAPLRLRSLFVEDPLTGATTAEIDFRGLPADVIPNGREGHEMDDAESTLADEMEDLRPLEAEAEDIRAKIMAKKLAISQHLRKHRSQESLHHLLKECDGLICAARVVAQRICDRIGVEQGLPSYVQKGASDLQHAMTHHDDHRQFQQPSREDEKNGYLTSEEEIGGPWAGTAQTLRDPLLLTKNATTTEHRFDGINSSHPLVHALNIFFMLVVSNALFHFIRRKCMPMRKRVDRLADREERRNARAYRKAARRAEMRRRWNTFVDAVSCFRSESESRIEDYEEKRALILQDAFLEQLHDLENGERGEIMEAEIRELRHAQEIVASLVRTDQHNRFNAAAPVRDPPPPMVALPFTPETRSRASTHTLPSYTSEPLPDYSSEPDILVDDSSGGSVVDTFSHYTPPTSEDGSLVGPPSASHDGQARYTPTSSVVDTSPRASEDTLRTRQSKDTQDL